MANAIKRVVEKVYQIFKAPWLNKGKLAQKMHDRDFAQEKVARIMEEFKETEAYEVIMAAMEDYREFKDAQMYNLSMKEDHYGRIMAVLVVERNMTVWFKKFVDELKTFKDSGKGSESDMNQYV